MITETLNRLIKKHGISNRALGKELGVSGQAVADWRSGRKIPAYTLPILSRIFKIPLNDFFEEGEYIVYGRDIGSVICKRCDELRDKLQEEERIKGNLLDQYLKLKIEVDRLTMK